MREYEIADKSYDKQSGELTQFLVLWEDGEPELKRASAENVLLFDPEDNLPFDDGLYNFLNGQHALQLSEEPQVVIAPTGNEYAYIIRVRDSTVETTPGQARQVLEGVADAAKGEGVDRIISLHDEIISSQVRRTVINALRGTFEESGRITVAGNGWLVDDFYLVDWSASLWTKDDNLDEEDYVRSGGSVVKDGSYEFVHLRVSRGVEPVEVAINGTQYRLSEREMLFLSKVKWLLNRRHYHPDKPFWMYTDKWAAVDPKTGEPEKKEVDAPPSPDEMEI